MVPGAKHSGDTDGYGGEGHECARLDGEYTGMATVRVQPRCPFEVPHTGDNCVSTAGADHEQSSATGVGEGRQADSAVIDAIVENLAALIARLRGRIDATEKADLVTQDMLIEIAARLEQLHWMWQAQVATVPK